MTVSSTTNREQYATDGVTAAFTIHFPFFNDTDINAILVDSGGSSTTLVINSDFTVTGGGGAGGAITCSVAPANGGTLTVYRDIPFTQEDDYVEDDPIPADTLEGGFDRAVMRDQQLKDAQDRSLILPPTVPVGSSSALPNPLADAVLGWNSTGTAIENKSFPTGTTVYASITNTRAGTATTESVTPDGLASLRQEGAALVSAASISKPSDANLGGYYTQSGNTTTDSYWAGVLGGEEMEIRYTGTPTLSVAGNLLPPGAAAYTVTAGTILRWRWDAALSKWRFVGGTRADGQAIGVVPSFSANKNATNQTGIAPATATKITFTTEEWDVGGYYDAPNSKFLPLVAGKYQVNAAAFFTAGIVDQSQYQVAIYKNGAQWKWGNCLTASGTSGLAPTVGALVDMNGTTDYIEIYAFGGGAGNKTIDGTNNLTWFQAVRVA